MEPMTLGSSPSSPSSPGINPNFLPNFLTGDSVPLTPNQVSPGRNRVSGSNYNKTLGSSSESRNIRNQKLINQSMVGESPNLSAFSPIPEKSGPPKLSLFDTIDFKKSAKNSESPILSSTAANYNEIGFSDSISRIVNDDSWNFSQNMNNANESMSKNKGANMNNVTKVDSYWVTVFGFPPSALTAVVSNFSNCGPIVERKIPSQGNWVHLKFNNLSEVSRALSLNGKMINNNVMIGVQLYYANDNKENDSMVFTSPMRARSLRHSFVSPGSSNSVVVPQVLPQKSSGIVTKAMEYVFGW